MAMRDMGDLLEERLPFVDDRNLHPPGLRNNPQRRQWTIPEMEITAEPRREPAPWTASPP
jgi:hypothetical protein